MRIAGLLPAGNIETPNAQLQVEWFFMTFHKSGCAEYMQSGCKLRDETLQTLTEYFQLIQKTCEDDGSLQRHQLEKVHAETRREMRQELEERYACKMPHLSNRAVAPMLALLYTMLTRQSAEHGAVEPQNGMSFPHSVSPLPSVHRPKCVAGSIIFGI